MPSRDFIEGTPTAELRSRWSEGHSQDASHLLMSSTEVANVGTFGRLGKMLLESGADSVALAKVCHAQPPISVVDNGGWVVKQGAGDKIRGSLSQINFSSVKGMLPGKLSFIDPEAYQTWQLALGTSVLCPPEGVHELLPWDPISQPSSTPSGPSPLDESMDGKDSERRSYVAGGPLSSARLKSNFGNYLTWQALNATPAAVKASIKNLQKNEKDPYIPPPL
jgi:hypothetical protein